MKNKLLFLLIVLFITPVFSTAAVMITLEIELAFTALDDPDKQLLGYKLYKDGTQICETNVPGD